MDQGSNILKWGLLAGGAFWLWRVYTSGGSGFSLSDLAAAANPPAPPVPQSAPSPATPAASSPVSPAPAPPTGATAANSTSQTAANLAAELMAAAAGDAFLTNGAFNLDHWWFYYDKLHPGTVTDAQRFAAFPGVTDTNRGPDITAAEFVARLQAAGVAGLGDASSLGLGAVYVFRPTRTELEGRPALAWATRRLDGPVFEQFPHRFAWGHLPIVGGR